ncbi:hypothetical protein EV122DRAFT_220036 [Schizophyllum commune]
MPSVATKRPVQRGSNDSSDEDDAFETLAPPPKRSRRPRPVVEEEVSSEEHEVESRPKTARRRSSRRKDDRMSHVPDSDDEDEPESEEETTKARPLDKFGSSLQAVSESHTRPSIREVNLEATLDAGPSHGDPKPTRIRRRDLLSQANDTSPFEDSNTSSSTSGHASTLASSNSNTAQSSSSSSTATSSSASPQLSATPNTSVARSNQSTATSSTHTTSANTSTAVNSASPNASDGQVALQYVPGFVHRPHYRYKAGDLDGTSKQVILRTCREYEALILSIDPFPDSVKQRVWLQQCFDGACRSLGVNFVFDDRLRSMIVGRGSRVRGDMLKITREKTTSQFKFRNSTRRKAVRNNLKTAEALKTDNSYLYQNEKTLVGYCRSRLVPIILQEVLFGSESTSFGVVYRRYFDPIPLPTLALVYSMINHCISEWVTGHRVVNKFTEEEVKVKNYQAHLKLVSEWAADEPATTRNMRVRWYRKIRALAGIEDTAQPVITISALARAKAREELSKHTGDTDTDSDEDDEDGEDEDTD